MGDMSICACENKRLAGAQRSRQRVLRTLLVWRRSRIVGAGLAGSRKGLIDIAIYWRGCDGGSWLGGYLAFRHGWDSNWSTGQ